MTNPSYSLDEKVEEKHELPGGATLQFLAGDIRRERTGIHALVAVLLGGTILAHDTFNIGRNEERQRLAKSAHLMFSADLGTLCPLASLKHRLDLFCLGLPKHLETRFEIENIHGDHAYGPVTLALEPFVPVDGGTILFAPPGAGKSFIGLLMAQSINQGVSKLWPVKQRKVLYVNLERPATSIWRRMKGVNTSLGLPLNTPLPTLTARGKTLKDVAPRIKAAVRAGKTDFIFLDSLSRAGLGTMVDDENANNVMDLLNSVSPAWYLIAHSPRADANHVFGSQMYDAAADVVIRLKSAIGKGKTGISLKMMKANDLAIAPQQILSLFFDNTGLVDAKQEGSGAYPELVEQSEDDLTALLDYLSDQGKASATQAAKDLSIPRTTIATYFHKRELFEPVGKEGKQMMYQVNPAYQWPQN